MSTDIVNVLTVNRWQFNNMKGAWNVCSCLCKHINGKIIYEKIGCNLSASGL